MDSHTLIQALIYLGAAALIVPVAVRLGLGSVLGYLIAGCVIGPWGFRLVTDAEAILHFAEIGVVLMLFVIGLELDPQRLWKLRASVFGGGALQMVACGLLLGGFCILLGMDWKVAELIGMTLALSSTAIAMQAMNERNLTVSCALSPVPVCAKYSAPWPCSWSSALGCCWRRWGCRWRWGRSSQAFCWRVPNTVTRWKAISSRLKACCWGCFSSAWGCPSTSARW